MQSTCAELPQAYRNLALIKPNF